MTSLADLADHAYGVGLAKDLAGDRRQRHEIRRSKQYRRAAFNQLNPRSEVYVRRGTKAKRILAPFLASTAAGGAGMVIGRKLGGATGANLGISIGTTAASDIGAWRNIKSNDLVAFNRRTGQKASAKAYAPGGGAAYMYDRSKR